METTINIKEALHKGVVTFKFLKKDGSVRVAKGTTKSDIIESKGGGSKGGDNKVKGAGYTSYFDLDKNDWRCFAESKLIEITNVE